MLAKQDKALQSKDEIIDEQKQALQEKDAEIARLKALLHVN